MSPVARTRIKICGLTREADVRAAVDAGADAVGFVLYANSPRAVDAARAAELARGLPPFVTPVLLFVNPADAEVAQALALLPSATLQFHGDETATDCVRWAAGRPWVRAARIPVDPAIPYDLLDFMHAHRLATGILVDTLSPGYGGSGLTFPWSRIPPDVDCHLVLSGGLTAANVAEGVRLLAPRVRSLAVDVSSGVEAIDATGATRKGIKDARKMQQFVAAVRAADARRQT